MESCAFPPPRRGFRPLNFQSCAYDSGWSAAVRAWNIRFAGYSCAVCRPVDPRLVWAIYRRPRTSPAAPYHRVFPYLLQNAKVSRANRVWAADIVYLHTARRFLYLVAVMDWTAGTWWPSGCATPPIGVGGRLWRRTPHSRCVRGTRLALPPQTGQLGEEPVEAVTLRSFPQFRRSGRHQGRPGFTDGMQQEHRVQSSPIFLKHGFQLSAGCIKLDQPVAGVWRADCSV